MGFCEAAAQAGERSYQDFCDQYISTFQESEIDLPNQISQILDDIWNSAMGHRGRVPEKEYVKLLAYAWYAYPIVWKLCYEAPDKEKRTAAVNAWLGARALVSPSNYSQLLQSKYPHPRIALFKQLAGLGTGEQAIAELYRDAMAEWRVYQPQG